MDTTNTESDGRPNVEGKRCPWCSMVLEDPSAAVCPECGAALVESPSLEATAIPGVTVIDPEVTLAERRAARQMQRAKTTGNATMFGITGVLLSKALSGVQAARADEEADLLDGEPPSGLAPTGLVPGGVVMAQGPAPAPMAPITPPAPVGPPPAPPAGAWPVNLPAGAIPATYVPVGMPAPAAAPTTEPADATPDAASDASPDATQAADPWRDLPPASLEEQLAGTEFDPWAAQTQAEEDAAKPFDPWAKEGADPWSVDGGPWSDANPPQWTPENQPDPTVVRPNESDTDGSPGDEPPAP